MKKFCFALLAVFVLTVTAAVAQDEKLSAPKEVTLH
jgi:hypothetical protein